MSKACDSNLGSGIIQLCCRARPPPRLGLPVAPPRRKQRFPGFGKAPEAITAGFSLSAGFDKEFPCQRSKNQLKMSILGHLTRTEKEVRHKLADEAGLGR